MDKSTVLPIGSHSSTPSTVAGLTCSEKTKILGIWFSNTRSPTEHYNWNFRNQVQKMRSTCQSWSNRTLSYKGKVTVFNVLVISLLQYVVTNTITPKRVFPEVRKIACDFLWDGKRNKIAYSTVVQDTQNGGMRLADLQARFTASMISWARRIILSPESSAANLVKIYCGEANPLLVWAAKRDFSICLSGVSPFYTTVLQIWHKFHNSPPPEGEEEIRQELVWNNPKIPSLSEHRSRQRWSRWIGAGILTIDQLCHPTEDRLMGHEELGNAYPIQPTFLEALALRNSIPLQWRRALSKNFKGSDKISYGLNIHDHHFNLLDSAPKDWYRAIIKGCQQEIKRKKSWADELSLSGDNTQIDWEVTYALPYKVIRETKIQSFHYRIAHQLITCNKYLCDIRMLEDAACAVCGETDTILHFFVSCPPIRAFWNKLSAWCEEHGGVSIGFLTNAEMVLGLTNENGNPRTFRIVNWLLLTAKFYIHRQRLLHGGEVSLSAFLAEIRKKLCIEKLTCRWEGKPNKFRIWDRIFTVLSP